jgi:hypothetical protein
METIAPAQKQSLWARLRKVVQSPAVRIVQERKAEDDRRAAIVASRVQAASSTTSST